jgi:hypothetical protein
MRLRRPPRRRFDQIRPDLQVDGHILPGVDPLCQVPAPGFEAVDPGLDRIAMAPELVDLELRLPTVVALWLHDYFRPLLSLFMTMQQHTGDRVMPIGKGVGCDDDLFSDCALNGEPAAVDLRLDILDDDATPTFFFSQLSILPGW